MWHTWLLQTSPLLSVQSHFLFEIIELWILISGRNFSNASRTDGALIIFFFASRQEKYTNSFSWFPSNYAPGWHLSFMTSWINHVRTFFKFSPIFSYSRRLVKKIVVHSHKTHHIPARINSITPNKNKSNAISSHQHPTCPTFSLSLAHALSQFTITFLLRIHDFMGL